MALSLESVVAMVLNQYSLIYLLFKWRFVKGLLVFLFYDDRCWTPLEIVRRPSIIYVVLIEAGENYGIVVDRSGEKLIRGSRF